MIAHPAFDLDWNLVRTFIAVEKGGSLAAGARSLGITHPTTARHVQQLEEALGFTLFSRTGKGLVLNELGLQIRDAAQGMHNAAMAFQSATDGVRSEPIPRVRLGVAEILAEMLPDLVMRQLLTSDDEKSAGGDKCETAGVTSSVDVIVTNDLLNLLERDADMALRHVRPSQQELLCKRVGELSMGIYAHRDYVAQRGCLAEENFADHRFIDGLSKPYLTEGAQRMGVSITQQQVAFRSDSLACRRAAVSAGWGIAALPRWMAAKESDWIEFELEDAPLTLEVWLVARPEVRHSRQLRNIFTGLGERLQSQLL